jgi:hypothetical protein
MCFCSGPEDCCSCGEEFNVTLEDEVLVVIAMVGVNLEDLEVQRSSCRESTWRSGGNSSCH